MFNKYVDVELHVYVYNSCLQWGYIIYMHVVSTIKQLCVSLYVYLFQAYSALK